ncbi:MAG: hypothetical protein LBF86_04785 [Helicobacteraceae bacterium]|jgi:FlaA1/EpsC-like NDP-sugar epimerase|nr:hypothetical protein [Helicobacteraceae bacterium]
MKQKAFVFGSGSTAKNLLPAISQKYEAIGFLDNNPARWTGGGGGGNPISAKKHIRRPR